MELKTSISVTNGIAIYNRLFGFAQKKCVNPSKQKGFGSIFFQSRFFFLNYGGYIRSDLIYLIILITIAK